jgi:hypothetical protein
MGQISEYHCETCGENFVVTEGGGFFFDRLHCDRCGTSTTVSHQDLGDIHLRFVKGLKTPYAIARAAMDRDIQANYPGEPITRDEYHAMAEATLGACACGGSFRYAAPPRCPGCRSTGESWSGVRVLANVD